MLPIIKCFSILVASGNGQRCNDLRNTLRDVLYEIDPELDEYKIAIWKYSKDSNPEPFKRISRDVSKAIGFLFRDIDGHFFSIDAPRQKGPN